VSQQTSSTPVSVRYVANAGVLVEVSGARVLIDAPVREGIPPYATSSADERTRLERAQPPYADVDAILVTHWHEDHFSAEAVAAHLASNRRAVLISSPEVVSRVRALAPDLGVSRLRNVLPAPGAWERVNVGPLTVRVLRARHNPTRRLPQQHVAFLLGDGPAVLHTGDADPASDNFTVLRELPAVDVALVPFRYLLDAPGRTVVREALAPRHIVAMHVPPPDAAGVARRLAISGMDAVLLTRPGMVVRDGVEVQPREE
jgi:L-ascorbate metabolism protein UlaG (beta-lactamase superfamily)